MLDAEPMKIAFVTSSYKPRVNGVSYSVEAFAEILRDLGHGVTVVAPHYPGYDDGGGDIVRIRSHRFFASPEDRVPNLLLPSSRAAVRRILRGGYDVIHTHVPFFFLEFPAVGWARRIGCPLVHTYHTHWELYTHYMKYIPSRVLVDYLKPVLSRFLNRHDLILSPSSQMVRVLRSYNVTRRIEVLPTGVDLKEFRKKGGDDFRRKWAIGRETALLLFVGRIAREKNIPFLFDVLSRVVERRPDSLLLLVGDGPDRKALQDLARRRGLAAKVRFCGYLGHGELIPGYHAADLFLFSSVTETQGIVIGEAMASGTPVVALSALGVVDILGDERGGILIPRGVERFSNAVLRLLEDPQLYELKRNEALQCARQWSIESMVRRLLRFYRELIEERKRRES